MEEPSVLLGAVVRRLTIEDLPLYALLGVVGDVVARATLRSREDFIRTSHGVETVDVSGRGVIRVVPLRHQPVHTLDRVALGVLAELQHLVVVNEDWLRHVPASDWTAIIAVRGGRSGRSGPGKRKTAHICTVRHTSDDLGAGRRVCDTHSVPAF